MMAFAVVMSVPSAASAAADKTCTGLVDDTLGVHWGGTYFCNYGYEGAFLQNNDFQVWVVAGSAHNIFTRWQKPNGTLSEWVNMGGNVKSNGNSSYLQSATLIPGGGHYDEIIRVIGTDSNPYCNIRNGATNKWNGWTQGHCDSW